MLGLVETQKHILAGGMLDRQDALSLYEEQLLPLCKAANEIRMHFCGNTFDFCTIINAKSGTCSEDCKYCAQSSYYPTAAEEYSLLGTKKILEEAIDHDAQGIPRFSIVTSGRKLSKQEIETLCESIRSIREKTKLAVCVSLGLLGEVDFIKLKKAGASRVHNNLETAERFFPEVCSTHSYSDKIQSLQAAKQAGLEICSGGILGLGETREDRIDMALALRELSVPSIPINVLTPIPGTPYEYFKGISYEEVLRTIAVYRFLIPKASIRVAGGRGLLPGCGRQCFLSGANGAITGDLLTTSGISVEADKKMLCELGYTRGGCCD